MPVGISDGPDGRGAYEDEEACGPDAKGDRSGAPRFPTRSSLVIVGIRMLNEERDSGPARSFLKNT